MEVKVLFRTYLTHPRILLGVFCSDEHQSADEKIESLQKKFDDGIPGAGFQIEVAKLQ